MYAKILPGALMGTILAQKALSAIYRMKEQVGIRMLIDVLRGSSRKELLEKGYDKIKTYGAGRDMSFIHWQEIVYQLLQLGLIEIAYDQGNTLKLTVSSREILFQHKKTELIHPADIQASAKEKIQKTPSQNQTRAIPGSIIYRFTGTEKRTGRRSRHSTLSNIQ